jgi:hypothetical protein
MSGKDEPVPRAAGDDSGPVTCGWCGATEPAMPLTWTSSTELDGRVRLYCDRCARENLRAIEGRLDSAWW